MVGAAQNNPLRNTDASVERIDYPASGRSQVGLPHRDVIDARGSIDSRTFDETLQISSVIKNETDRPDVNVDDGPDRNSWHSRAGQGFNDYHRRSIHYRKAGNSAPRVILVIGVLVGIGIVIALILALSS